MKKISGDLQINYWGEKNSHLLSMKGKAVSNENFQSALNFSRSMEEFYHTKYGGNGVGGLAACQIAQNIDDVLSLILLNEFGHVRVLANPQIIKQSTLNVIGRIGCFSAANGEKALQAVPQWMQVQYLDLKTQKVECIQLNYPVTNIAWHEMTHLRGASYEEDMLPGTRLVTQNEFEKLNAHTDEEKFKLLLGTHPLSAVYTSGEVVYSTKTIERFILDGLELEISK